VVVSVARKVGQSARTVVSGSAMSRSVPIARHTGRVGCAFLAGNGSVSDTDPRGLAATVVVQVSPVVVPRPKRTAHDRWLLVRKARETGNRAYQQHSTRGGMASQQSRGPSSATNIDATTTRPPAAWGHFRLTQPLKNALARKVPLG